MLVVLYRNCTRSLVLEPQVDDEETYSAADSLEVASDSSYCSAADSSDSNSEPDANYDGDDVLVVDDDEESEPVFCYDIDAPCVDEGVIYPDVNSVKSALTHHAILTDYAFCTIKKDKSRFRAKCKKVEQGCKWTFFASTSKKFYGCKASVSPIF